MSGLVAEVRESQALPSPAEARDIRRRADVTQVRMAEELQVAPLTVLRWEQGVTVPKGAQRLAYARLLRQLDDVVRAGHRDAA